MKEKKNLIEYTHPKYAPRIRNRQDALRAYRKLINDTWRCKIPLTLASTLRAELDGYIKAEAGYKLDEIEAKILSLEEELHNVWKH